MSFADCFHDHHGGIYQAGGWIYSGKSATSTIWKLPNGTLADPRRFNGHGHNKPSKVPKGSVLIKTPGKHRYLMPLDNKMKKQILPLAKAYPKRAGSDTSDTPAFQAGEGGSLPTPALHSQTSPKP